MTNWSEKTGKEHSEKTKQTMVALDSLGDIAKSLQLSIPTTENIELKALRDFALCAEGKLLLVSGLIDENIIAPDQHQSAIVKTKEALQERFTAAKAIVQMHNSTRNTGEMDNLFKKHQEHLHHFYSKTDNIEIVDNFKDIVETTANLMNALQTLEKGLSRTGRDAS